MGFIKAFTGALGGSFADQWLDFYKPMPGIPATAGIFPAVSQGTNQLPSYYPRGIVGRFFIRDLKTKEKT